MDKLFLRDDGGVFSPVSGTKKKGWYGPFKTPQAQLMCAREWHLKGFNNKAPRWFEQAAQEGEEIPEGCFFDGARGNIIERWIITMAVNLGFKSIPSDDNLDLAVDHLNTYTYHPGLAWGFTESGDFGCWREQ